MAIEIIDLTDSPPSPPRSSSSSSKAPMILNFGAVSAENVQFQNAPMYHTNQHQTHLWPASGHTHEPLQNVVTRFQPNMFGNQVATVLEPVPESSTFLFPHGARLREPWTQREHELFLMGLIKFGKGRWSKIAKHFLWNKTPQQVQSYAASFFRHLPSTYLYGFRRRKPTNLSAGNLMVNTNRNHIDASASYNIAMVVNEPQNTLTLFPDKAPFVQVPPYGEGRSSSITTYGFQMLTSGASTSKTASNANGEVDLELRLG